MFDYPHPACGAMTIDDAIEGRVHCDPPRKKVALIGFGSNTRSLAPYTDPSFEVWGMNQAFQHVPRRAERWFEVHRPEHTPDMRDPNYLTWLKQCPIPVYMQDVKSDVPMSVKFPVQRLIDEFKIDYFTSSIAFMIALAIAEKFEEIHLYGIDLVTDEEYASQKPCVEWWLGIAYGRGINIYIPEESALLKQPFRYGYDVTTKWGGLSPEIIERDLMEYGKQNQKALAEYHTSNGAIQYAKHLYDLVVAANRGAVVAMPFTPTPEKPA